ncbi:hypothetical protein X777_16007 [Ooceraea biroi]|uniref:Uncharacterized protein n=1 Tax=Ooceraea biroi TaxID=2015173 RepID=A0A026WUL8_OOCBI|nr:hypothetical protein X777_16007 [Ooceraea biroi]
MIKASNPMTTLTRVLFFAPRSGATAGKPHIRMPPNMYPIRVTGITVLYGSRDRDGSEMSQNLISTTSISYTVVDCWH